MPKPGSTGFITATAGVPKPLSANNLRVRSIRIQPRVSLTVMNVDNVYIKNAAGQIYAVLGPEQVDGRSFIPMGDTELIDLSEWFFDVAVTGDGIICGYVI
jgi:hypothetical protein